MEEIRLKIAIVDDIESNLIIIKRALEKRGFAVCTASNGKAGVTMIREERPDLVIMDLNMPSLNGWEATEILKGDPTTRQIPVVALSAGIAKRDESRLTLGGFDGWCAKPIKMQSFIDQVYAWLDPAV